MVTLEESIEAWTLSYDDTQFIDQYRPSTWFDYALKLISYRATGQYARPADMDSAGLEYIANQLELRPEQAVFPIYGVHTERSRRREIHV